MKFIELTFVVKETEQQELINVEHISRIMYVGGKPFIGMIGHTFTRQLTIESMNNLVKELTK